MLEATDGRLLLLDSKGVRVLLLRLPGDDRLLHLLDLLCLHHRVKGLTLEFMWLSLDLQNLILLVLGLRLEFLRLSVNLHSLSLLDRGVRGILLVLLLGSEVEI